MNNIKDYENLSSKRVLLRLDLNVPLKNGDIVDETRIIKIIPVIEFLIKRNFNTEYGTEKASSKIRKELK